VSLTFFLGAWAAEGVAFRLEVDGWQPGVEGVAATYTGLAIPPRARWPRVRVTLRETTVVSVVRIR
jgi:hypothetical protein